MEKIIILGLYPSVKNSYSKNIKNKVSDLMNEEKHNRLINSSTAM